MAWWRRRVPLAAVAVVMVVVLLAGELGARFLEDALPPERGPLQELLVKDQQIHALARRGGAEVLFVGSSTTDAGVDPTVFDRESAVFEHSYNAALKGMPVRLQDDWLDQVLPLLRPEVVVVDLQPTLVIVPQGKGASEYLASLNAYQQWLRTTSDAPLARADRWLSSRSTLVRERRRLQQPALMGTALKNRLLGRDPAVGNEEDTRAWVLDHTTDLGRTLDYREGHATVVEDRGLAEKFDEVLGWKYDLREAEALVRDLQGKGVRVVLSVMPIDIGTLSRLGLHRARYDRAIERIRRLADDRDVPLLELGTDLDPLDYHDKVHLADPGSNKVSTELARRLDRLCGNPACAEGS